MIKANPKTQATTQEQGLKGISYCPWGVYGASAGGGGMYIYPSVRFAKTKRFFAGIAQLGERLPCKQSVVGSMPTPGSIFCGGF